MRSSAQIENPRSLQADAALLVLFLVLSLGVGLTASWFTLPSIPTWYATLEKPEWTPPNGVFGPVWTLLYILMAIAAWRIARSRPLRETAGPLTLWALQLALNFAWSLLFFYWHRIDLAFFDIIALWAVIAVTLGAFASQDRLAAGLLVPYLLWVSYALALNGAIYGMNP